MQSNKYLRAFTLIELLVVISIVSLLSSVTLSSLNSAREKARIASALQFESSLYRTVGASAGGFWRFDENTGTSVSDASGNGSTGTLVGGTTWSSDTPTGSGSSLSFNGTTGYVDVAAPTGSDLAGVTEPGVGYTMAAWFKASGLPQSTYDGYIVTRVGYHSGLFMNRTSGAFGGVFWFSDNTGTTISSNVNINDGKWHYLALSVNDSSKQATLYLDGRQVGSVAYTKTLRPYGNSSYRIGGTAGGYFGYGLVDNPVVFGMPYR